MIAPLIPVTPPVPDAERPAYSRTHGFTKRQYLAAHAPVTLEMVVEAFGTKPNLALDNERAAFMAVWAVLRFEYADAMMRESSDPCP